jgi:hypothetical protein
MGRNAGFLGIGRPGAQIGSRADRRPSPADLHHGQPSRRQGKGGETDLVEIPNDGNMVGNDIDLGKRIGEAPADRGTVEQIPRRMGGALNTRIGFPHNRHRHAAHDPCSNSLMRKRRKSRAGSA